MHPTCSDLEAEAQRKQEALKGLVVEASTASHCPETDLRVEDLKTAPGTVSCSGLGRAGMAGWGARRGGALLCVGPPVLTVPRPPLL